MTIIEDTRNQIGKHQEINQYFKERGIKVLRSKLPYGDYGRIDNLTTVIDTKAGFEEIVGNFASKDRDRVKREILHSKAYGVEVIFLIVDKKAKCIEDAQKWVNKRGRVSGETLYKILNTFVVRYNVRFEFCTPEQSGPKILELLGVQP